MTLEAPTHGPCAPVQAGALTLTDLKEDYMEDWQRLSSMMLLDSFWKATIGRKVCLDGDDDDDDQDDGDDGNDDHELLRRVAWLVCVTT